MIMKHNVKRLFGALLGLALMLGLLPLMGMTVYAEGHVASVTHSGTTTGYNSLQAAV